MNDHGSKKLIFNKSTLFSLKAELLRKQDEVKEKKRLPQHKVENYRPPVATKCLDSEIAGKSQENQVLSSNKKSFKDNLKAVDTEELEACKKAKAALERKAELYEHLADSAGKSKLGGQFLVDFDTKKQENARAQPNPNPEPSDGYLSDEEHDEWTEFTDCLGRTRKCLKSDLEFYQKRDKTLAREEDKEIQHGDDMTKETNKTEKPFLVQKTNDYLQTLRKKWEEKERELLAKDKDIHYQDLLFDEARMHGVGYFQFSTDETERRKQMTELERLRTETIAAQKAAEESRMKQEQLIAARVAASRARLRLRAGLPPEEPKDETQEFTDKLLKYLQEQRDEAENKAKEIDRIIKEEQERERERLRKAHVREWDVGKEGVEEKTRKFVEMTQEEYVAEQRNKRIKEFAPPQTESSSSSYYYFDETGTRVSNDNEVIPVQAKTWSDVRPKPKTPPPPKISDFEEHSKRLYFTSKPTLKYKNFVKEQAEEPTPIQNELSDDEDSVNERKVDKRKASMNHTEIPPPPTWEHYGPNPKQSKRSVKPFNSDLREAFEQGTKSLETKSHDKKLSDQYDFTFN